MIDYVIRRQLARRNVTPDEASYLRGLLHEQRKVAKGGNDKVEKGKEPNRQSDGLAKSTAAVIASETGVSPKTVERDAAFARAVDKLDADGVLPKADALAGKAKTGLTRQQVVAAAKAETPEAAVIDHAKHPPGPAAEARDTRANRSPSRAGRRRPRGVLTSSGTPT